MANIKIEYGTASQGITCTLASLADNAARECTAIDNTSNKFVDAIVYLAIKLATGTPVNEKAIFVWFYGTEDGTNYGDNASGADAAVTLRSPHNFRGPHVINTPDAGALTYKAIIPSVAAFFGGVLPPKWGFVVENQAGIALDSTEGNHTKEYRGIYQTVV